jgi:hypothetical protein
MSRWSWRLLSLSHPAWACPRNLTEGDGDRKDNRQKTKHS